MGTVEFAELRQKKCDRGETESSGSEMSKLVREDHTGVVVTPLTDQRNTLRTDDTETHMTGVGRSRSSNPSSRRSERVC